MSGGQDSMQTWRKGSESVLSAREVKRCHRSHQSTPGSGLKNPGADYTSITGKILLFIVDAHSKWIDATSFHRHPCQRPSTSYVQHLPPMASQKRLSLTMAQHSLQVSSKSFCDPITCVQHHITLRQMDLRKGQFRQ